MMGKLNSTQEVTPNQCLQVGIIISSIKHLDKIKALLLVKVVGAQTS